MIVSNKMNNVNDKTFIKDYLTACGVDNVDDYLVPVPWIESPHCYKNIVKAIAMLSNHIDNHSKTVILADVDIDGNCSAAIQYLFLKENGIEPTILYHTGKQHGLKDVIDNVLAEKPQFVWIADAGSNDVAECATLKENGIDVLITDHHVIEKDNPYAVVINNQVGDVDKELSGCGMTYQMVRAYYLSKRATEPNMWDLVALSIIGDACSLLSMQNRFIVYHGLTRPNNEFVKLLLSKCTRYGNTPKGIGWEVAPLCNALARSDEQNYKSLFVDAMIGKVDAEDALKEMRRIKRLQDTTVKAVVDDMESNLDNTHKAVITFMANDYTTYSGLIAGKLCGKYNKPTFVLRERDSTTWSGSMRSPIDMLHQVNESKLAKCQGHEMACGVIVKKSNLKRFAQWLDTLDLSADTVYDVTATLQPKEATLALCQLVNDNAMLWGKDIDEPTWHFVLNNPTVNLFKKTTTTLKLQQDGVDFMKFRLSDDEVEKFEHLGNKSVEIIGKLSINEYNGVKTAQVMIDEYEIIDKQEEQFDFDAIFE